MKVAICGLGPAGKALARALHAGAKGRGKSRLSVIVSARDPERARAFADAAGVEWAENDVAAARSADVVLFCVHEAGLVARAAALAAAGLAARVALHTAGSRSPEDLNALREAGWPVGRLHPLIALCEASDGSELRGATWSLAGDERALVAAQQLLSLLDGRTVDVRAGSETLYHAGAALVAGGAVALVHAAAVGIAGSLEGDDTQAQARRALASLLRSVARNLETTDAATALTGPVPRGSADTVGAHLDQLSRAGGAAREFYVGVLPLLIELSRGRLDEQQLAQLLRAAGLPAG